MAISLVDTMLQTIGIRHFYERYRRQFIAASEPQGKEAAELAAQILPEWEVFEAMPVKEKRRFAEIFTEIIAASIKAGGQGDTLEKADSQKLQAALLKMQLSIKPKRAKIHFTPDNRPFRRLTDIVIGGGHYEVEIGKGLTSSFLLAWDTEKIGCTAAITEFEKLVYTAVASLWKAGNRYITPQMVVCQYTQSTKPQPEQVRQAKEAIERLSSIRCEIDCTEELKARAKRRGENADLSNGKLRYNLLYTTACSVTISGHEKNAYELLAEPILLKYAQISGQLLTWPANLYQIVHVTKDGEIEYFTDPETGEKKPHVYQKTERATLLVHFLLTRIAQMRRGQNNAIALYDYEKEGQIQKGLISRAGYPDKPTPRTALDVRRMVETILCSFKAKGHIRGFEWYKNGNTIAGVKIFTDEAQPPAIASKKEGKGKTARPENTR